jgi:hypothetical protein
MLFRMNTIIDVNPELNIKVWALKTCDVIHYDDYPELFARLSFQGSVLITLLRNNGYSIDPAYQLGILFRIVKFSTIKTFVKKQIPPYMLDDAAILFPETNELMLLNKIERSSVELKKVLKNVALLPSGVVHALPGQISVGKFKS